MYIEISNLPETLNLDSSSVFPVVYQGQTKKVTFSTLQEVLNYFNAVSYNKTTGQFTFTRVDGTKAILSTDLNSSIKDASLSSGVITFTKQDDTTITVDLTGFQPIINNSNKLASDLVDDTNSTNKFVTATEKAQITTNTTDISNIKDGVSIDSFSDVETALGGKADTATTLAGYRISDAYTKTEVDTKISSVYKYKGTVSTYADLPSTDLTVGDVYNIETADSTHGIKAGDNVAWNGTAWDVLAGTVDLTDYVTNTDYATSSKGGVVKIDAYAITKNSNGNLMSNIYDYNTYGTANSNSFISKGTLENVITGKGIVDSTKIKTTEDTTAGNVYDVTYINTMIGDIESILEELDVGGGV